MIETREHVDKLLNHVYNIGASDLHMQVRNYPVARVSGDLILLSDFGMLSKTDLERMADIVFRSDAATSTIDSMRDLDFAYEPSINSAYYHQARYRVSAVRDVLGIRIVLRRLPSSPPTPQDIMVPENCTELIGNLDKGLVLVTGPTGSGKSTTLASWIAYLLSNYNRHIITLEDPIEFMYDEIQKGASIITQREKGKTLASFQMGLHSALREDPDVILVGEMRDSETIKLALEAAETGHLVFGTLHTASVPGTLSRVVSTFPYQEQESIRSQLIASLRMVICQNLYKTPKGGRCASREYLIFNPEDRDALLKVSNNSNELTQILTSMVAEKGVTMERSIIELFKEERINAETFDDAMRAIQSPVRSHLI